MSRQQAGPEQRRAERMDLDLDVSAEITISQPARIVELSHDGARIVVDAPLRLETIHDLTLRVADAILAIKVRVVHCRLTDTSQGHPTYEAGLEFVDITSETRRAIDEYVAGLGGARA